MLKKLVTAAIFAAAGPVAAEGCAEGQRALEHYLLDGTVCVPANPERVAFAMEEIINAYVLGGESVVDSWYF